MTIYNDINSPAVYSTKNLVKSSTKKIVTNWYYSSLFFTMLIIVGCLSAQNALYGVEQGTTIASMVVFGAMYFAGDWALATLMGLSEREVSAKFLQILASSGLVLLSFSAGLSFMLSHQHQKDISNSQIISLERDLAINQEKFQELGLTKTANRITNIKAQLQEERRRVGANHASSNALYVYASKLTGYSFESVSFFIRSIWISVFIITGMALSTLLSVITCPWKESSRRSTALRQRRTYLKQKARELTLLKQEQELLQKYQAITPQNLFYPEPCNEDAIIPQAATGTLGERRVEKHKIRNRAVKPGRPSVAYEHVKLGVISGKVEPTVRSLCSSYPIGSDKARLYLKQLAEESIIQKRDKGRGYNLIVA